MAFSAGERKALLALARAAFPAGRRAPAVDDTLADRVDRFLSGAPADARWFLRAVLWMLEWAAMLRHGRRLSRLPDEAARRYVEGWTHSRFLLLRLCFRALISPLKIVHYGEPQVARALGSDPARQGRRRHHHHQQRHLPARACARPRSVAAAGRSRSAAGRACPRLPARRRVHRSRRSAGRDPRQLGPRGPARRGKTRPART